MPYTKGEGGGKHTSRLLCISNAIDLSIASLSDPHQIKVYYSIHLFGRLRLLSCKSHMGEGEVGAEEGVIRREKKEWGRRATS